MQRAAAVFDQVSIVGGVQVGIFAHLADLAVKEKDHPTHNMLQWFISEQVEEEASADYFVQKLSLAKDSAGGLFMLDRAAAARAAG